MRNPKSTHIDKMDTISMVNLISDENINAFTAVKKAADQIAKAVDAITKRIKNGGRLFYIGAGTSGRLAVADAAECPPTYGVSRDLVVGIIAGGEKCLTNASEGDEDKYDMSIKDLKAYDFNYKDALVGISAAGGAAYIVGALDYANSLGALSVGLSCNENSPVLNAASVPILTDTGAEVITGSTRMNAGTAHKMVLNILSTCAMVKTGKVYENYMINLKPSNIKLRNRMIGIVSNITDTDSKKSQELLEQGNWEIRKALGIFELENKN